MKKEKMTTTLIVILDVLLVVVLIALIFYFRSFFSSILESVISNTEPKPTSFLNSETVEDPFSGANETEDTTARMTPLGVNSGTYSESFSDPDSGYTMNYFLHIPDMASEDMPLIVFLHGIGEVGSLTFIEQNPIMETAWDIYGSKYPFILLVPNANVESWTKGNIPKTVKGMIDEIVETYKVDDSRITITGFSLGATGVYKMIEQYGDFFNKAVIISTPIPKNVDPSICLSVPMKTFAGSLEAECDKEMQKLADKINELGGFAEHRSLDGFNHTQAPSGAFTESLYRWILEKNEVNYD